MSSLWIVKLQQLSRISTRGNWQVPLHMLVGAHAMGSWEPPISMGSYHCSGGAASEWVKDSKT